MKFRSTAYEHLTEDRDPRAAELRALNAAIESGHVASLRGGLGPLRSEIAGRARPDPAVSVNEIDDSARVWQWRDLRTPLAG